MFGPDWGDRSPYRESLAPAELDALESLPGASEYRIQMAIDKDYTTVTGRQQVHYTNRENVALDILYLRLFPNALGGEMSVSDLAVDGIAVGIEYLFDRTAIKAALPEPLRVGNSLVLSLSYRIRVPETLETGYGLISFTGGILALDTPYAPIPVYDDEGWNVEAPPPNADTSFNDASFYLVQVAAPATLVLVASGTQVERETGEDTQRVTFALGPARDFYLAGSDQYVVKSDQVGEVLISSHALPGRDEAAGIALETALNAMRIYGQRFGPYPYAEFEVAATPMLALGIEYPGVVGISDAIYDLKADSRGIPPSALIESTVAHEVAHQWFYNLVGNDQVDEPWLDEAFAQYGTLLYYIDRYGEQGAASWRATWVSRWDRVNQQPIPIGKTAAEYDDGEYGAIIYGRGPLFLEAVAERMGNKAFDRFLEEYVARFRWDIASTADFKAMAEEACNCQMDDLYAGWLDP